MSPRYGAYILLAIVAAAAGCGGDSTAAPAFNPSGRPQVTSATPPREPASSLEGSLQELVSSNPEPVAGCGSISSDPPEPDLQDAVRVGNTFCDDETGLESLLVIEFKTPGAAKMYTESPGIFNNPNTTKVGAVESVGDAQCAGFAVSGETSAFCIVAAGQYVIEASGNGGVSRGAVMANGVVPLLDWIRSAE